MISAVTFHFCLFFLKCRAIWQQKDTYSLPSWHSYNCVHSTQHDLAGKFAMNQKYSIRVSFTVFQDTLFRDKLNIFDHVDSVVCYIAVKHAQKPPYVIYSVNILLKIYATAE